MGYEVHIVRTDSWLEADTDPIRKEDVDRLIAADPELEWSNTHSVDLADEQGKMIHYPMILWQGNPVFWWCKSEILSSNPQDAQMIKMVKMARALGAKVLGDEMEQYDFTVSAPGKEQLIMVKKSKNTTDPQSVEKQCPFCGGHDFERGGIGLNPFTFVPSGRWMWTGYYVTLYVCMNCGAMTPFLQMKDLEDIRQKRKS